MNRSTENLSSEFLLFLLELTRISGWFVAFLVSSFISEAAFVNIFNFLIVVDHGV
jgi:hypothetical protein